MQSPLADPRFRRLFGAQVIALAGTGLSSVALALLAFDLAGGAAGQVLGTALVLKMVAYVGMAPLSGWLAQHCARKTLLVSLDVIRALLMFGIVFVSETWHIYVLIFAINACSAVFTPTFQATIPDILPDDARYTRALSLSRLAYDLENLLSPVLAAAALVFVSYHVLFGVNAATFVVSALLVLSVRLPGALTISRAGWSAIGFGVRAYLATPRLRGLLALSLAVAAGGAMVIVNTVVIVRDLLGGDEVDTALAYAAFGAGSMVVALLLPRWLDTRPDRPFMLAGAVLTVAGLGVAGLQQSMVAVLIAWCILGAGSSLIQTPAGRLLKRSANEPDRPALYAAQFALSHACWLIGYAAAGWLGPFIGLPATATVLGLLAAAGGVAAWWYWPAVDPVELVHVHDAITHEHVHVHDDHHQHGHHQHGHRGSEPGEPHSHPHTHDGVRHRHAFVIDDHHAAWPWPDMHG